MPAFEWPFLLKQIPDPPKTLRVAGVLPPADFKLLAIVGSRAMTNYGREAIEKIVGWLRGEPVSIVSGLALGVDAAAHRAALREGLHTIAVPGSGLDGRVIYPRNNEALARDILEAGGALLSEFPDDFRPRPESFPQRNRIMAGMSHATLLIEAQERSGTLITARLALDYNRNIGVVPGSIFSAQSRGVNRLLREGASPILDKEHIFELLKLPMPDESAASTPKQMLLLGLTPEEQEVVNLLEQGGKSADDLIQEASLSPSTVLAIISSLSIKGIIKEELGQVELRTTNRENLDNKDEA